NAQNDRKYRVTFGMVQSFPHRVRIKLGGPPPPNDGAEGEKSAYLSGNSTPSANCLGGRRGGGIAKSSLTSALFWPSANGLAWRKAPLNHRCIVRADKCYLIATMPHSRQLSFPSGLHRGCGRHFRLDADV